MVIGNSAPIIKDCLISVRDYIDHWVILDTGSDDETKGIVHECLKEIPGTLHAQKWTGPESTRNEALDLARGQSDYLLFMNAEEKFMPQEDFSWQFLKDECYLIPYFSDKRHMFHKISLIKDKKNFFWEGGVCPNIAGFNKKKEIKELDKAKILSTTKEVSQEENKSTNDNLKALRKAVKDNPEDTRSWFYLAMTYVKLQKLSLALKAYLKRVSLGGAEDEVFYSYFCAGGLQYMLGKSASIYMKNIEKAHKIRPHRPEPLYYMACHFLEKEENEKVYEILFPFMQSYKSKEIGTEIFYSMQAAEVCVPFLYAQVCDQLQKKKEAKKVLKNILKSSFIDPSEEKIIQSYLDQT